MGSCKQPEPLKPSPGCGASCAAGRSIERKIAELKAHGLRRARYWGSRKVLLQARLTALLVNLKRLFTLGVLEGTPRLHPA